MSKKENLVEDTLLQIKNLEESLKRNAQGILSSTMKEEIKSLVKESLNEEDEEVEVDAESGDEADLEDVDATDSEDEEVDTDNVGDEDNDYAEGDEIENVDDTEEVEPINMTQASDAELFKVFKRMKNTDGITVVKDDNMLHIDDENNDTEYLIQLSESEMEDEMFEDMEEDEMFEDDYSEMFEDMEEDEMFEDDYSEMFEDEDEDELSTSDVDDIFSEGTIYELEVSDEDEMYEDMEEDEFGTEMYEDMEEDEFGTEMYEDMEEDEFGTEMYEDMEEYEMFEDGGDFEPEMFEDEYIAESSKFKAKGVGMGSASKFKYDKKPNMGGGFKTVKRKVNKTMGTGKAKFEYKEGMPKHSKIKKVETKEASRTLGSGKRWGRNGLDKPRTAPRHLRKESIEELKVLRGKNQEYKQALDVFRNKLNEVAVFNSNLAYATRLFTEHSTTKQEKINILKRFDNVENLKESKNLYRSIKNELTGGSKGDNTINESIERNVIKTPSTGSAVNLIESKTYENPQFLRMKDLMSKIK
jgi:hypothetical protein